MKKITIVFIALLVLAGCANKNTTKQELRVYNWGSYIDESLITEFEKEFDAKVIYDKFDSNEAMYIKVASEDSYDVLYPTDYMIERLRVEDRLQKLDYSKIPNYTATLDSLKGRAMDPTAEYTAGYFWGNVGIVYDKTKVSITDLEQQGWNIFKNENYKDQIFFLDSERDAFMVALKALGYSMNTTSESELQEAFDWLKDMNQKTRPVYIRDEMIDSMVSGVKPIGTMYSGDATYVLSENENMAFYVPTQGTNSWMDAMVITKNAKNVDLAHEWINFILSKESQQRITEEIGYTSARQDVIDIVTGIDGAFNGIDSYETRQNFNLDENYRFDDVTRVTMADYWVKVKSNG